MMKILSASEKKDRCLRLFAKGRENAVAIAAIARTLHIRMKISLILAIRVDLRKAFDRKIVAAQ